MGRRDEAFKYVINTSSVWQRNMFWQGSVKWTSWDTLKRGTEWTRIQPPRSHRTRIQDFYQRESHFPMPNNQFYRRNCGFWVPWHRIPRLFSDFRPRLHISLIRLHQNTGETSANCRNLLRILSNHPVVILSRKRCGIEPQSAMSHPSAMSHSERHSLRERHSFVNSSRFANCNLWYTSQITLLFGTTF